MEDKTEELEYLKRVAAGEHDAFDILFLTYQPKVVSFLEGFLHDEEDARNMAQDIFMNLWNRRTELPGITSFPSYLFKMAKNALANHFRHESVHERYKVNELLSAHFSDSTEEEVFLANLQDLISMAVEQMPEQRKRIFKMSRNDGLSNEEIAKECGLSKRTVENHISRALADLRKIISCALVFFI